MAYSDWPPPLPWITAVMPWDATAPPWRQPPHPFQAAGWICAGCGRGFSPQVTECPYCPAQAPADVRDTMPVAGNDLCFADGECVPADEGGTCAGGRHCGC